MGLLSGLGSFFGPVGTLIGGAIDESMADDGGYAGRANYDAQREFAQNGLQWKAADARAAGLHPLAALGGSGAAFSPSFVAGQTPNFDTSGLFDDMDSMKAVGQNTDRAQRATISDYDREMQAATLRNQQLQNALIEGQLAETWGRVMGQPSNPPGPGPQSGIRVQPTGQVKQGVVQLKPSQSESTRPGDKGLAAGTSPLFREQQISNNTSWDLLSPEAGELFEAYGEFAKPVLAGAVHAKRWWDNTAGPAAQKWWDNRPAARPRKPGTPQNRWNLGNSLPPLDRRPWSKN